MLLTPPPPKRDVNCSCAFFPPPKPPAAPEQLCLLFCSKLSRRIRNDMKQLMCRAKLMKEEEKRQE